MTNGNVIATLLLVCFGWRWVVLAGVHYNTPTHDDDHVSYAGFFSKNPIPFPRSEMKADLVDNPLFSDYTTRGPRIFLIGGCTFNQTCNMLCYDDQCNFNCVCPAITNKCTYYTPKTDEWFDCASAPVNRYMHATAIINNKIYLTGGRDIKQNLIYQTDVYDPLTDTWTTPPHLRWGNATGDHQVFVVGNSLYLLGGYDYNWNTDGKLVSVDVITGIWNTKLAPMRFPRGDFRVAAAFNSWGTIYAMGGFDYPDFCNPSKIMEKYHVATNNWTLVAPMTVRDYSFHPFHP